MAAAAPIDVPTAIAALQPYEHDNFTALCGAKRRQALAGPPAE